MAYRLKKRLNRSWVGSFFLILFLAVLGIYSALPIIISINQALKPMSELYVYPPKIFVHSPTLDNFRTLFDLISTTRIPFSRYLFNTILFSVVGTVGHILLASMCAYPLAKYEKMPGAKLISAVIVYSLMISPAVTDIANYQTMAGLHLTDTFLSVLLPAFASSLGLYIMRQFILQIPDSLIEAAKIDGANEFCIFFRIIFPNVKPAWLTLALFSFQQLWNGSSTTYLYSEEMKPLSSALSQLSAGGISRTGASAAVVVIMMSVPILFFLVSQNSIMETMATSGLKD